MRAFRGQRSPALARLCQFDVLGADEERRLFRHLKQARDEVARSRVSDRSTTLTRADTSAARAIALRNRIAICNLRLVVSVAKHFATPQQSLEDLVSEASLLLLRCVEQFDAGRGTRFSTYATRALAHHFARLHRRERKRSVRSLSVECVDRRRVDSRRHEGVDRLVHVEELQRLQTRLAEMLPRERALVARRFGLGSEGAPLTFQELGDSHGLSKEWARVITAGALERLREAFDCEPAA
ncbi:MAG TPA: sigma-70 family RNA polymerase sigma factor [Planctomycetaceae bacterium]|jgi:RNA polymerase primary sigma factor|nr:sigma-70 family RNA polymerase sigma factor [Planctomycetaceae bacterium]